jgi:putative intracellular protease/amidase
MWKRWILGSLAVLALLAALAAAGLWWAYASLDIESMRTAVPETLPSVAPPATPRGRILAVVSSGPTQPHNGRKAGYELTELSRAWAVFVANGFDVDIASPKGGEAPMKLDDELIVLDHAFLADAAASARRKNTLKLAEVDPAAYAAVYFVGGKGTLWDFANDPDIARIGAAVWAAGGVIAAVCHGPAALLGIRDNHGRPIVEGRRVTGFSNDEERFLIPDADRVLPYLLADRLIALGARYEAGPMYLDHTVVDGRLVTGQNPWSTFSIADATIRALGHRPVARTPSAEEHSVAVLAAYQRSGIEAARSLRSQASVDRHLLAMHALIALMQWRPIDAVRLHGLARPWPGDAVTRSR